MPGVLDFVFSFGHKVEAVDVHFGGCRFDVPASRDDRACIISELGRSGLDLKLCYTLKSIEPLDKSQSWSWSLRPATIYHSLDLESGSSMWIFIKADKIMKNRVSSLMDQGTPEFLQEPAARFIRSFEIHLIPAEWSIENWRRYLNYMMGKLKATADRIKTIDVDRTFHKPDALPPSRIPTLLSVDEQARKGSYSPLQHVAEMAAAIKKSYSWKAGNNMTSKSTDPVDPQIQKETQPNRQAVPEIEDEISFSFDDIQDIQFCEENANDAKRAIRQDINVIGTIKQRYLSLWQSDLFSKDLRKSCSYSFTKFQNRLDEVVEELQMHLDNMQMFLELLTERKRMVCRMKGKM